MNFLAHLFLSCQDEELLIGNFIADFITNKEVQEYSPSIQEGIMLHRKIDSYTDNHKIAKKSVRRLYKSQGKYAPVVMDVLFDHLLANNWKHYSGITLSDFSDQIYAVFESRIDEFPEKLRSRIPKMVRGRFLEAYATEKGIRYALSRMDLRTKFPSNFTSSVDVLKQNYSAFETEFELFFPQVIDFVDTQSDC